MAKIKVHNILHTSGQALLTLQLEERKMEFLASALYPLREEGISIPFIVQSIEQNGNFILTLLTDGPNLDWVRAALQEGLDLSISTPHQIRKEVALITLYGPHLGERPGIAHQILSSLATDRVEVLALSASINSCLLAVPQDSLPKCFRSLDRIFEIPMKEK